MMHATRMLHRDRFGVIFRASPRQSDLSIAVHINPIKCTCTRRLYEQMLDPNVILSMGSCANGGKLHIILIL